MEVFFFWLIGSVFVGFIASSRGRSGFGYFMLSVILSPILVGIFVVLLPSIESQLIVISGEAATPETHVRCPDCRELIRMDARKCKHCGTALIPQVNEKTSAQHSAE